MTYYEGITTVIALLAVVISAVALHRAGIANKTAREANDLARAQDELARLQLQQEQDLRRKTTLSLSLVKRQTISSNGRPLTSERFRLTNDGEVTASNAGFEILSGDSPLVSQDYAAKLPATLAPKQSIEVLAAIYLDTSSRLDVVIFWTNPDGSLERQERMVTT